jgi:hypothetical protein
VRTAYAGVMVIFFLSYLASIFYFVGYLRRVHVETWADLGRPDFAKVQNASIQLQFRQLQALFNTWRFIFSNAHASMNDTRLSALVWLLRVLIAGCFLTFAGLFVIDHYLAAASPIP